MTSPHILMYSDKKARGWERCQASFLGFAWWCRRLLQAHVHKDSKKKESVDSPPPKAGSTSWL